MILGKVILILNILTALYAFPYGKWEWQEQNKSGGLLVYTVALICISISIWQLFV